VAKLQDIHVGKIIGVFGIKGWVKVFSLTQPLTNILAYSPWTLKKAHEVKTVKVVTGKHHANGVIATVAGITDRDQATTLVGYDIWVQTDQLPQAAADEYYWFDLVGLRVYNQQGQYLGEVESIMETGANDVLVLQGDKPRAIPFLQGQTVLAVDVAAGTITVDWDIGF
jgi:16S rRNA processing protein RimM